MILHGALAVQQAHRLATIAHKHRRHERSTGDDSSYVAEPPSLAYYVVYFASAVGFLIMCVVAAFD